VTGIEPAFSAHADPASSHCADGRQQIALSSVLVGDEGCVPHAVLGVHRVELVGSAAAPP